MKRSRFSEEQIIAVLKEQEAGMATADVCRRHGISHTVAKYVDWPRCPLEELGKPVLVADLLAPTVLRRYQDAIEFPLSLTVGQIHLRLCLGGDCRHQC